MVTRLFIFVNFYENLPKRLREDLRKEKEKKSTQNETDTKNTPLVAPYHTALGIAFLQTHFIMDISYTAKHKTDNSIKGHMS